MNPLLLIAALLSQVTVPNSTPQDTPIVASLTLESEPLHRVSVSWSTDENSKFIALRDSGKLSAHVWAGVGEHWVKATATIVKIKRSRVLVPDEQEPQNLAKAKPVEMDFFLGTETKEFPAVPFTVIAKGSPDTPITDKLVASVQSAYAADPSSSKAADAKSLATLYRALALQMPSIDTTGTLATVIESWRKALVDDRLKSIRVIFGTEFNTFIPPATSQTITDDMRAAAIQQFNRYATILEGLK